MAGLCLSHSHSLSWCTVDIMMKAVFVFFVCALDTSGIAVECKDWWFYGSLPGKLHGRWDLYVVLSKCTHKSEMFIKQFVYKGVLMTKLSATTLRCDLYHGRTMSWISPVPWFISRGSVACRPRYSWPFKGYDVALSQFHQHRIAHEIAHNESKVFLVSKIERKIDLGSISPPSWFCPVSSIYENLHINHFRPWTSDLCMVITWYHHTIDWWTSLQWYIKDTWGSMYTKIPA